MLSDLHAPQPRRSRKRRNPRLGKLTTTEEGNTALVGLLLDQSPHEISTVTPDGEYGGDPVYQAVAERAPDAAMVISPRAMVVLSATAETASTQRDRHIQTIAENRHLGWQKAVGYGKRSLIEMAMLRYKALISRSFHSRTLPTQKTEAKLACKVINITTGIGMPVS
ncbi:hypothetical protein GGE65_007420 [Skermanella aerolata]|uniref:hypothetical protein n=1 Tax=Skermanella aerolata TaxID=393310 RepID=UPI003D19A118